MPGVGIRFEEWVQERIEAELEYGDTRSEEVNNLCRVGIAARDRAEKFGAWPDGVEDQEDFIVEAIESYCREGTE